MSSSRERITDDVAEHLARLLQNADQLLGEWKSYSEKLRGNLDAQAAEAGERAARAMRESLGELRGLDLGGAGKPRGRAPWLWVALVNVVVGAVLALLISRQGSGQPAAVAADAAIPSPVDAATLDAAVPIDAAPAPLPPLCAGLLRGVAQPSALQLIRACAVVACGHEPPAKDPRNRALSKALAECQPEREAATLLALTELLGDGKALGRCRALAGDDGGFAVDERFFASCRGGKSAK